MLGFYLRCQEVVLKPRGVEFYFPSFGMSEIPWDQLNYLVASPTLDYCWEAKFVFHGVSVAVFNKADKGGIAESFVSMCGRDRVVIREMGWKRVAPVGR